MDADLKARVQVITDASSVSFDKAAQYDTTVVGLGYVAFFALWGGVSKDIPRWAALGSAALIGLSLLCYITWVIVQMLGRHKGSAASISLLSVENALWNDDFLIRWNDAAAKQQRTMAILLKAWLPVFYVSFVAGLAGAALLSGVAGYQAVQALSVATPKQITCVPARSTPKPTAARQREAASKQ